MVRVGAPGSGVIRWGRVVEVRGTDGGPPYVVRFGNGRTELVVPGPDVVVQTREMAERNAAELQRRREASDRQYELRARRRAWGGDADDDGDDDGGDGGDGGEA